MAYTPIKLDKVRNFRYGMKAIHLIEKKLKKNISKVNFDDLSMEEIAIFMWAGLEHEDKNLTPDKVMDLVDEHSNFPAVSEVMFQAFRESFGIEETEEEEKEKN